MTGCDAVQLFPSLRASESGKAVRDATINIITNTDFRVEGLDFKEIAKYVRMNLNDKEIKDRELMSYALRPLLKTDNFFS